MMSDIQIDDSLRAWRFMVKFIRIYSFEVFGNGPFTSYILSDTAGNKCEMIIPPQEAYRFRGMEEGKGNWVKISCCKINRAFHGFRAVNCPYRIAVNDMTRIYPIAHVNDHHYMEFKAIREIKHTDDLNVAIDTIGVVVKVEPLKVSPDPSKTSTEFHIRNTFQEQITCFARGKATYAFQDEFEVNKGVGAVVVVLKMWRICKHGEAEPYLRTHMGLSDFRVKPTMIEVDDFIRQLPNGSNAPM